MRSKRTVSLRVVACWVVLAGWLGANARAQENVETPAEVELPGGESTDGADVSDVEEEAVEPWAGTFAEGMGEVVRLAANEEHAAALELTEGLLAPDRYARLRARLEETLGPRGASWLAPLDAPLAWIGLESLDERTRAEVRYVRGLLCARTGALIRADEELGLARALAGPGVTRNDAIYALGTLDLALAEELRRRIPEISGAQTPAPPVPTAPGSTPGSNAGAGAEDEPDALDLARAAYLEARAHLVERLRIDWRDPNTRANTELVQRRLRELDEIEREREKEQEEQQESQPQDSEDQDSESEDSEDQESEDQESQEQESEDQESDQESDQQQDSENENQESEEDAESEDAETESETELEERVLTQEEMMRLLEEFQRYQERGEEILEQNRRVRREKVEKDW